MKTLAEALGTGPEELVLLFDLPISFHRCLVPATGGITTALLLSHAIWVTQSLPEDVCGWFTCSSEQWTESTGLSRREQETARRALCRGGFITERRYGMPARLWSRVNVGVVLAALRGQSARRVH